MNKKIGFLFSIGIICFFLLTSLAFSIASLGVPAPRLKLPDLEKNIFDSASLKGKKVMLIFWASWSEPSLLELVYFEKSYSKIKERNFEVIAVNLDQKPAAAKFFAERRQITFPVLLDLKLISPKKFQLLCVPTTFIIDEKGKISEVLVNFNQEVANRLKKIFKN